MMSYVMLLILFFTSTTLEAVDLPSLVKRLDVSSSNTVGRISRVHSFEGRYSDGYIYDNLAFPNKQKPIVNQQRILEILEYFDEKVIPSSLTKYLPDRVWDDSDNIVILFDNIHDNKYYKNSPDKDYPAFFSKEFSSIYRRHVIVVDINYINDNRIKLLLSHELMHVFRYMYNPNEEPWVEEGLSKLTEYFIAGTDCILLDQYEKSSNLELKYDYAFPGEQHYAHNMLYMLYLYKNFGLSLIRKILSSESSGAKNINQALLEMSATERNQFKKDYYTFEKTFINFSLSLILNQYQKIIESSGLLTLDEKLGNFSIMPETIDYQNHYKIYPWAVRIYLADSTCVELSVSHNKLVVVAMDIYNNDEKKTIRVIDSGDICFEKTKKQKQYIAIINPSDQSIKFQFNKK